MKQNLTRDIDKFRAIFYPEIHAGGFSRDDGTVEFYSRVRSLVSAESVVLDFGAGVGGWYNSDTSDYRRNLRLLKGHVARVIGVDLDERIHQNETVDEAHLITLGDPLPLDDNSVDVIVTDYVIEHVDDPVFVARDLDRVLRPGGWICARTPNRWGYIGIGATLFPNTSHVPILRFLQPERSAQGVFPTVYKMNTKAALRRYFDPQRYSHYVYAMNNEPDYVGRSRLLAQAMFLSFRVLPEFFAARYYVFLQKQG